MRDNWKRLGNVQYQKRKQLFKCNLQHAILSKKDNEHSLISSMSICSICRPLFLTSLLMEEGNFKKDFSGR